MDAWITRYAQAATALEKDLRADLSIALGDYGPQDPFWNHPHLFRDMFPAVAPQHAAMLGIAGRFVGASVRFGESVQRSEQETSSVLAHQELYRRAFELLYSEFPPSAPFWRRLRTYVADTIWAYARERQLRDSIGSEPCVEIEQAFRQLACRKVALGKLIATGMAYLGGSENVIPALEESQDEFALGSQLFHDLAEWKKDLAVGRQSWVLWRAANRPGYERRSLLQSLHGNGFSLRILREAECHLERAQRAVAGERGSSEWRLHIDAQRTKTEGLRRDFEQILTHARHQRTADSGVL